MALNTTSSLLRTHYVHLFLTPHSVISGKYLEINHDGCIYVTEINRLQIMVYLLRLRRELAYQHTTAWPSGNYFTIMQPFNLTPFPDVFLSFILPKPFPNWQWNLSPSISCLSCGYNPASRLLPVSVHFPHFSQNHCFSFFFCFVFVWKLEIKYNEV